MKTLIGLLGLALGTFLNAAPASAATVASFSPSSRHVNVYDFETVDITISGLECEVLSAFEANVLFSSTMLGGTQLISMNSIKFDDPAFDFDANVGTGNNETVDSSRQSHHELAAIQTDGGYTFLTFGWGRLPMACHP